MYFFAQILGIIALLITICSFFTKNKIVFIIFNLSFNFILAVQYFLLNKNSAGYLCLFASFRYVIYMQKGKNKFFSGIWIPIFFFICNLIISIYTFEFWYDIFPTISALTLCITPWSNNIKVLKLGSIGVCPLWFVYDIMVLAWTSLIMEIVTFVVTLTIFIVQIINEKIEENKLKNKAQQLSTKQENEYQQ